MQDRPYFFDNFTFSNAMLISNLNQTDSEILTPVVCNLPKNANLSKKNIHF